MADRTIKIVLDASVTGLVNGFKTASTAAQDFGNRLSDNISKNEQHINSLSNTLGGIGLGLVAGFGVAVKTFADFDQAMSNVAATGEDARGSIDALRAAAIKAGADTSFSATEAAGAIEELAKAGLSAGDILNGGLAGALDLAAAGGLSVADAAQYASTAMAQFGLKGKDVTHIADLLAAGAGKANGSVSDMGAALNQAGLVASQTGLTIEETTGSLAAFAQAGLLGSDAGTSLKTMLQRLSAPSGEAAGLMEELGISAYDASGNFVGMANFAGQLTDALGAMTPAQRNAAMATIFGADAVRAAGVIYQNGEAGIRDWITAVDDQGYAAETARTKLDNLKGDLEGLGGSLETAFINGGSAANEMLRGIVQGADAVVDALGGISAPVLNATTLLVGGAGLVALGTAGLGKLVVAVNNVKIAMAAMGISAKAAGFAVGAVGGALAIAAVGLTVWASNAAAAKARTEELQGTLDEFGRSTDQTLSSINSFLSTGKSNWLDGIFGKDPESLIDTAERYGLAIEDLQGYILGQADATDRVNASTSAYLDGLDRTGREYENKKAGIDSFIGSLDSEKSALDNSMTAAEQKAAADQIAGVASEEFGASVAETSGALAEQTTTLEDVVSGLGTFASIALAARDAERGFEAAVDDAAAALAENGATLDITTEKGRANQAALDGIAAANVRLVSEMQKNGASQAEIQGAVGRSRAAFLAMAQSMGMSAGDAEALANKLGLIPGDYTADVNVQDNASAKLSLIQSQLTSLTRSNGFTITTNLVTNEITRRSTETTGPVMQARATGGPVSAGRPYLVGEEGMEIFVPKQSGTILNASDTARAMQGRTGTFVAPPTVNVNAPAGNGGPSIHNTISADGLVARGYAEQIANRIVTKQRDSMALYGIGGAP